MHIGKRFAKHILSFVGRFRTPHDSNFVGFDKYKERGPYHWMELNRNTHYRMKITALESFVQPHFRCVDLGCGDGAYMSVIAPRCSHIVGVDADYFAIRAARAQLKSHGIANVACIQAPLSHVTRELTGAPEGFDFVYSMDVIEHLPRPEELLQIALAVAKPDAWVAVGTPLFIRDDLVSPYHVREFRRGEIQTILRRYLRLLEEQTFPMTRRDGNLHPDSFYLGVGKPLLT